MLKLFDAMRLIMALITLVLFGSAIMFSIYVIDPAMETITFKLGKETSNG